MASVIYSGSSLCTLHLWHDYTLTPYEYSMGTKPILLITDLIQNGFAMTSVSIFSIIGIYSVQCAMLPLFFLKCILSSLGSYCSSLGLDFGRKSTLEGRCSKIVSFSIVSAIIPLCSVTSISVQSEVQAYDYIHALLGALNGLCVAFVLSYNGALTKVALSSIKDVFFLAFMSTFSALKFANVFLQAGVSTWISFKPSSKKIQKLKYMYDPVALVEAVDRNKHIEIEIK